jgi:hypothetical protein
MKWARHVARMGRVDVPTGFGEQPRERDHLEDCFYERIILK